MIFDKGQKDFPSDFHREVWWWAVGLVPPAESLTDGVKTLCGADVLAGCYEWHAYFITLTEDMYNHAETYAPATARQYRDILEAIARSGEIQNDAIQWPLADWKQYEETKNRGKAYKSKSITLDYCLNNLKRTGLKYYLEKEHIFFEYPKYKKIFHTLHTFEKSPHIEKTPARHHFAHCECRQLFKSYAGNYDELLRRVSDESRAIAHAVHAHCQQLKIQRYIHFDTIKFKYAGERILHFTVAGDEYPTLRVNIGPVKINPFKDDLDRVLALITERKETISKA